MFMKKICFLTLGLVGCFGLLNAQNTGDDKAHKPVRTEMSTKTRFGIKAGVNMANINMDDEVATTDFKTNGITSWHAGLFANLPLGTGNLRLQPELLYSRQGSRIKETGTGAPAGQDLYDLNLSYLSVPIMFQFTHHDGGLYFELGPTLSFLTTANREYDNGSEVDYKDAIKKTDFAASAGLGYLTRVGVGLSARYNYGISNVFNSDDATAAEKTREFSTRLLQVGLVYHFGAHK
jgi:hypothetical protein